MKFDTIAIAAAAGPEAQKALASLCRRYETVTEEEADIVVALGGDGFMLESLHRHMKAERTLNPRTKRLAQCSIKVFELLATDEMQK